MSAYLREAGWILRHALDEALEYDCRAVSAKSFVVEPGCCPALKTRIEEAINRGSQLWNAGNVKACVFIYLGLCASSSHRHLTDAVRQAESLCALDIMSRLVKPDADPRGGRNSKHGGKKRKEKKRKRHVEEDVEEDTPSMKKLTPPIPSPPSPPPSPQPHWEFRRSDFTWAKMYPENNEVVEKAYQNNAEGCATRGRYTWCFKSMTQESTEGTLRAIRRVVV